MGVPKGQITIDVNDIVGKRLGKLEVMSYHHWNYVYTKGGLRTRHFYECKCECGTVKLIQRGPLVNEIVYSCGCCIRKYKRRK